MSLKDLIFQKGGIGTSMSRAETVERLNPLLRRHMVLNHRYDQAAGVLADPEAAAFMARSQKTARVDVGKLAATVFSAGGVAYNGTHLEARDYASTGDEDATLFDLLDAEQDWQDALLAELQEPHQIRSAAVLSLLRDNSRDRLEVLKQQTRGRRRPRRVEG